MTDKLFDRGPGYGPLINNALFALAMSVLIWAGVGTRLTATRKWTLPLDLVVPAGLDCRVKGGQENLVIEVTFEGQAGTLSSLSDDLKFDDIFFRPHVEVDPKKLGQEDSKDYRLVFNPSQDLEIPERLVHRLRAVSCKPAFINLELSPIVTRRYKTKVKEPVFARRGLALRTEAKVQSVAVSGPLRSLRAYERLFPRGQVVVETEELQLQGRSQAFEAKLRFDLRNVPELSCRPKRTEVAVSFEKTGYENENETKTVELEVFFNVSPGMKQAFIYELRPPRKKLELTLEIRKALVEDFMKALKGPKKSRPYAFIQVPADVQEGTHTGELILSGLDASLIRIKGDVSFLYSVKSPQ